MIAATAVAFTAGMCVGVIGGAMGVRRWLKHTAGDVLKTAGDKLSGSQDVHRRPTAPPSPPDWRIADALERLARIGRDFAPQLPPPDDLLDGHGLERFVLDVQRRTRELWSIHLKDLLEERLRLLRSALASGDSGGVALHAERLAAILEPKLGIGEPTE